jgi:hypothetical protein
METTKHTGDLTCQLGYSPQSTYGIYLEYHSGFPLVGIGTPSPKRVCTPPPPEPKRGGTGDTLVSG